MTGAIVLTTLTATSATYTEHPTLGAQVDAARHINTTAYRIGSSGNGGTIEMSGLILYKLPELPDESVNISKAILGHRILNDKEQPTFDIDLYGLGYVTSLNPADWPRFDWHYCGDNDISPGINIGDNHVVKIQDQFLAAPHQGNKQTKSQELADFLNMTRKFIRNDPRVTAENPAYLVFRLSTIGKASRYRHIPNDKESFLTLETSEPAGEKQLEAPSAPQEIPIMNWAQPQPNQSPSAGYQQIQNVTHYRVFEHSIDKGIFNHHARITYVNGTFFAAWSNGDYFEDSAGQRIMIATSPDGQSWSDAFAGVPALGPPSADRQPPGRRAIALNWVELNGEAYVLGLVCDWIKYSPTFDCGVDQKQGTHGFYGAARRVAPNGQLGPLLWLGDYLQAPFDGFVPNIRTQTAKQVLAAYLEKFFMAPAPVEDMSWSEYIQYSEHSQAADGRDLCEPVAFRKDDGTYITLWRGRRDGEHKLYASSANSPESWSKAIVTEIPDAPSQCCGGKLPDGRIYLIGNQTVSGRDPLTLSLSSDEHTFDWTGTIRTEAPTRNDYTHPISGKKLGKCPGYQYPGSVIVGTNLWVIYSVTKENIEVSKIPLSSLPGE
jgi:hypothetical protein